MKVLNQVEEQRADAEQPTDVDLLLPLVVGRTTTNTESAAMSGGVVVGELVAMTDDGRVPLVVYPGQTGTAAISARSVLDLHSDHIGKQVVLVFDSGDPTKPIVVGVLRDSRHSALDGRSGHAEVETDGERMIVDAKQQLVLRCGKASITLTRDGKVLVQGAYISSRSTGVNRIKGGSVQLN